MVTEGGAQAVLEGPEVKGIPRRRIVAEPSRDRIRDGGGLRMCVGDLSMEGTLGCGLRSIFTEGRRE